MRLILIIIFVIGGFLFAEDLTTPEGRVLFKQELMKNLPPGADSKFAADLLINYWEKNINKNGKQPLTQADAILLFYKLSKIYADRTFSDLDKLDAGLKPSYQLAHEELMTAAAPALAKANISLSEMQMLMGSIKSDSVRAVIARESVKEAKSYELFKAVFINHVTSLPTGIGSKQQLRSAPQAADALVHFLNNAQSPSELSNLYQLIRGITDRDRLDKRYYAPISKVELLNAIQAELSKIESPSKQLQQNLQEFLKPTNLVWENNLWGGFPAKDKLVALEKQWKQKSAVPVVQASKPKDCRKIDAAVGVFPGASGPVPVPVFR